MLRQRSEVSNQTFAFNRQRVFDFRAQGLGQIARRFLADQSFASSLSGWHFGIRLWFTWLTRSRVGGAEMPQKACPPNSLIAKEKDGS